MSRKETTKTRGTRPGITTMKKQMCFCIVYQCKRIMVLLCYCVVNGSETVYGRTLSPVERNRLSFTQAPCLLHLFCPLHWDKNLKKNFFSKGSESKVSVSENATRIDPNGIKLIKRDQRLSKFRKEPRTSLTVAVPVTKRVTIPLRKKEKQGTEKEKLRT